MNGKKSTEVSFENDAMHGPFTGYHTNGKLSMTATYDQNYLEGALCIYDETETLLKKEVYSKGQKNGTSQMFYPSGGLYEDASFEQDKPVGKTTLYHENQKIMSIKYYEEGRLVLTEVYDDNGKVKESIQEQIREEGT